MLMKSLTWILAVTSMLAVVVLWTPAVPAAAAGPVSPPGTELSERSSAALPGFLAELWQDLWRTVSAASCNEEDPCAEDACNPEFCTCDSDPCAEDACDPDACDGNGGGDGGGNGGRFNPGG